MASTTQVAKAAAAEDKKPTGPAGLPNTRPASKRTPLTEAERAQRKATTLAKHTDLLEKRTQEICFKLQTQGVSSLCGRIQSYDDVPDVIVEASIAAVRSGLDACEAVFKARSATQTGAGAQAKKVDLRAIAAKMQAERNGTPAVGSN